MADVKSASDLYRMGCNYYAIRNYRKAQEYLIHAVIRGSSQAARRLYQLGCLLLQRQAGDDLHCAEVCFQTLADRGDAESCLQLGLMCKHGRGRRKDLPAAFGYFDEAWQLGNPRGAYEAGMLILPEAWRDPEAKAAAVEWFKVAAEEGITESYRQLGFLFLDHTPEHDREALQWFLRGAEAGDTDDMVYASDLCFNGAGGARNVLLGVALLRRAADRGNQKANSILGDFYGSGKYVERNEYLADQYYTRAQECENDQK